MYNNTCFRTYLYSTGTHHGNMLKSPVVRLSRVIYLFRGPTGKTALIKCRERTWGKWRWMDWGGRNYSKEEIPGNWRSICGYILTHSKLWQEKFCQLWVSNREDLVSASAVPQCWAKGYKDGQTVTTQYTFKASMMSEAILVRTTNKSMLNGQ